MEMRGPMAVVILLVFTGVMAGWMLHPPSGDPNALAVLTVLTGILGGAVKDVISFYFGSSQGSKEKDDTISKIATQGTGDGSVTTAKPPVSPPAPVTSLAPVGSVAPKSQAG